MADAISFLTTERGIQISEDNGATWLDVLAVDAESIQLPASETDTVTILHNTGGNVAEKIDTSREWGDLTFSITRDYNDAVHNTLCRSGGSGILVAVQIYNGAVFGLQFKSNAPKSTPPTGKILLWDIILTPCHDVTEDAVYPPVPTP